MVVIYGVATFYKSFNLKPRGRHIISICLGTACHVRGGPAVAEAFEKELGISAGETTEDKEFTLETVACLGACALGPIVVADGHYYSKVGPKMAKNIIQETAKGLDMLEVGPDQETFPVELSCPRCNHTFMDPHHKLENLPSIKVTVSFGGKYGWLRLSALYGSYTVESKHEIPKGAVVNLFCPNCHGELLGSTKCAECGAGMVPMIVRGGGIVQICLRRGCKGHMLDLGSS